MKPYKLKLPQNQNTDRNAAAIVLSTSDRK